jgi:cysteine/O-acetylserine efflux protein
MENIDILSFNIFVLISTFTPGPGNITSSGMGMSFGYKGTLRFIGGIVSGYLTVMVFSAFLSAILLGILPKLEPVLRIMGTVYILWMALKTAKSEYNFSTDNASPMLAKQGFLLQVLNPKAVIFGLTIYTTFLSGISTKPALLWASIFYLSIITFFSVSLWAMGGAIIKKYLHLPGFRKWSNVVLTILLVYCALMISGLL